jgi:hypothetical protein
MSCELPFWLPLWYLQAFLFGHCIACHVSYRSDYPFDIFKLFLLVIVLQWQAIQWPTRKVWRYQRGNQNGKSHDMKYNDQQEKFEDIKGVIRTVHHNKPFWLPFWYLQTFLVSHCISYHVIYRSDYPFDIFKLFLLVIVLPVMWVTDDQQEKFEDIKEVIRTVSHMRGNTMTNKKSLKISKG